MRIVLSGVRQVHAGRVSSAKRKMVSRPIAGPICTKSSRGLEMRFYGSPAFQALGS